MRSNDSLVALALALSLTSVAGCSDTPSAAPADAATDSSATDVPTTDAPVLDASPSDVTDAAARDAADVTHVDAPADVPATDAADAGATCVRAHVLVATSAFGRGGGYAVGPLTPPALTASTLAASDQDHVVVESGCMVFDLFRGDDVLQVLDTAHLPAIARSIPLRTPLSDAGPMAMNLVNPYDVLVVSPSRALVVQYALSRVAIVDPSASGPAAVTGSIDLSPVRASGDTDPGGAPEAAQIVGVGPRAYVLLQNLASFAPVANGTLAILDTAAGTLIDADSAAAGTQPITLSGRNPNTVVAQGANRLVVSLTGAFGATDGGIETVDLSTNRPSGLRVTEAQLGGDVSGFVMLSDTRGWALVSRSGGDAGPTDGRVVEFDLAMAMVTRTIATVPGAFDLGALALAPDGTVWLADRTAAHPGVRVFRPDGTEVTTTPLATGTLPPSNIVFVP